MQHQIYSIVTGVKIPEDKRITCITGSVWTGSRRAPRHILVKEGYVRPVWFTTEYRITDAEYRYMSETGFHLARANDEVFVHITHGGNFVGIMKEALETALAASRRGVLVVGPQELVAQVAAAIPHALVFTLKETPMQLSPHLTVAEKRGQLHRLDVDVLAPGAWATACRSMLKVLGH